MKDILHTIFYWLNVLTWARLLVLLVTRREVKGRENLPRRGPVILVSNHLNLADPPIITVMTPRRIVWMAKQELFDIPFFGGWYRILGLIPVRRFEADLRALRRAQDTLRKGLVLGMFPEGTRTGRPGLNEGEPGTALLALRSGAPIVPVGIWGTEGIKLPANLFKRTTVHLRYGQPYRLEKPQRITKQAVMDATDTIMRSVAELLPAEYRGRYGEPPPAQPQPKPVSAAVEKVE